MLRGHPLQGHRWQVPPRQELSPRRIAKQSVNRGPIKKCRVPVIQLADWAPTERQVGRGRSLPAPSQAKWLGGSVTEGFKG
ncbi:hypothetical protein PAXINDRAFT_18354 [Paxillus involutus ATCC 200175]|uniref:Uncharacterized protein n=1 Tax=Paxillus involutus ATCC 200175 TaxID=664439 RepID=A0A0C9TL84_PAXIN|nr:hypothetical protein PAXINDRAFT_18354 [Paxillus involutus ATCC 200175]